MFYIGDAVNMVNIIPHMDEYRYPCPVAKHFGGVKLPSTVTFMLPTMTNKTESNDADMFVMPFEGGLAKISCETVSPMHTSSAS